MGDSGKNCKVTVAGIGAKIVFAVVLQVSITAFMLGAFIVIVKLADLNLIMKSSLFMPIYFLASLAFASFTAGIVFCMLCTLFKKSKATIIISIMLGLFVTILGFVVLNHYDPLVLKQRVIKSLITGTATFLLAMLLLGGSWMYKLINKSKGKQA